MGLAFLCQVPMAIWYFSCDAALLWCFDAVAMFYGGGCRKARCAATRMAANTAEPCRFFDADCRSLADEARYDVAHAALGVRLFSPLGGVLLALMLRRSAAALLAACYRRSAFSPRCRIHEVPSLRYRFPDYDVTSVAASPRALLPRAYLMARRRCHAGRLRRVFAFFVCAQAPYHDMVWRRLLFAGIDAISGLFAV